MKRINVRRVLGLLACAFMLISSTLGGTATIARAEETTETTSAITTTDDGVSIDFDNMSINDIVSNIVYNAKGSNVNTTIINGKIVMENRKITNCNEEDVYEKCQKIAKRILQD